MGTFANARAFYGASAIGSPTKTNVRGNPPLGVASDNIAFDGADIFYSFLITPNDSGDVATLTVTSGAVAQTTGTPTITDAGEDFEGEALLTMVTGFAILIQRNTTNPEGTIAVASSHAENPDITIGTSTTQPPILVPLKASGTIAFTIAHSGDSVTVTVIGKSS